MALRRKYGLPSNPKLHRRPLGVAKIEFPVYMKNNNNKKKEKLWRSSWREEYCMSWLCRECTNCLQFPKLDQNNKISQNMAVFFLTDRQNFYSLKSFYMTYREQHINLNGSLGDSYSY